MPIQLREENAKRILVIRIGGKLAKADYIKFVLHFERLVLLRGKLRVLFDMTGFRGWDAAVFWDDIKFDLKHFTDVVRIAMIGDHNWQLCLATFCQPFTIAPVRYFGRGDAVGAREWLGVA